ncbi:MAG: FAD-binding protein [Firmicutes bacterium]|nr:FAD-binding protein [Bacillota bacterium]
MIRHRYLIVGGGLAGLRAAVELAGQDVAVLARVQPLRSHSVAAAGGINAALGNNPDGADDTPEKHAFDTIKGSDYLADQDAVEIMAREAIDRVIEAEHWGCPFSRFPDGRIAQRPFGGAGFPRTCYAADRTGHALLHTLYEQAVRRGLHAYEEWVALELVVAEGRACGLVAMNLLTGQVEGFVAQAVIFATGGAGRMYLRSSNALLNTGSGMAIAYRAGVPLKDMEFIQFHPTTLYGSNILITEGARGEGGYLLNNKGQRFMERYAAKAMELAPRDIVARAIQTEIDEGRGFQPPPGAQVGSGGGYVHLDLRHLGEAKINERLPKVREISVHIAGVDPVYEPIPIQPAQHYTMGGIDTDNDGATQLPGFFAAGEAACVSVHGANRLGGNSLLDTIVFGRRAGAAARRYVEGLEPAGPAGQEGAVAQVEAAVRSMQEKIAKLLRADGPEDPAALRDRLRSLMSEQVGIFREREPLEQAVAAIADFKERYRHIHLRHRGTRYNLDLYQAVELEGMLDLAEVIARGALLREESRGSQYRRDFPQRDDANWLKHTLAYHTAEGPRFAFKPVTITRYEPQERRY